MQNKRQSDRPMSKRILIRLGPLVKVYVPEGLAYNRAHLVENYYFFMEEVSLKLWTVTSAALPSMINLEHLKFGSILQSPSAQIIQNCRFLLRSMHWKSSGDSKALCTDFLASQNRMEHLDLEFFDSDLPQGVCPRLKSIRSTQATWLSIREGRTILALDTIFDYRRHNLGSPIPMTAERLATRNLIERDIAFLACERFGLLHQVIGDGGLHNLVLLQINKTCVLVCVQVHLCFEIHPRASRT